MPLDARLLVGALGVATALVATGCPAAHETDACPSGRVCTVAGTGEGGFGGDGRPATEAELWFPIDVTVAPDGALFIADFNNHRVRRIGTDGLITTVAGSGVLDGVTPGPARESGMNHPTHVMIDADGSIVISAWHNSRVVRVDLATEELTLVAGDGRRSYAGDGGPPLDAALDLPVAVVPDPDGGLLLSDQVNQVIRRIDPDGVITTVAGTCRTGTCESEDELVACPDTDKLACAGDEHGCTRPCLGAFEGDGGPASLARFHFPFGAAAHPAGRIALGARGELYVADTENDRVRRIDRDGTVHTVAGGGSDEEGDGGPATAARLDAPSDVAVGPDGTVYVTETAGACVRAVSLDGTIHTVAGVCGERGSGSTHLDLPAGIDVGPDGTLYVADTGNHRVVRATP